MVGRLGRNVFDGSIYGPYIINGAGPHLDTLRRLQPRVATVLDPNVDDVRALRAVCPHTQIVGRIYKPDSEVEARIRANPEDAAAWAHELANANSAVAAGLIDWVHIANEICQFADGLPLLNRFELRRMELEERRGRGAAIGGFSVGQLDLPPHDRMALYRLVYPMLWYADRSKRRHVLAIHQYGAPDLYGPAEKGGAPWLINRFEVQVLPRLPMQDLGIVVQEYGRDGLLLNDLGRSVADAAALAAALTAQFGVGVVTPGKEFSIVDGETRAFNSPPRGWSVFSSAEEYVRELLNMAQWLEQFKNRMLGYCLFCVGKSSPWETYDHAGPVLEALADAATRTAVSPVPEPVKPPVEGNVNKDLVILDKDGNKRDWAWLQEQYGNVRLLEAAGYPRFKLVRIEETEGVKLFQVSVLNKDGIPHSGQPVCLTWPTLANPSLAIPEIGAGSKSMYAARGVVQSTENGTTGYGLGPDSYTKDYAVGGPYSAFVLSPSVYSDCLTGVGWQTQPAFSNHKGPCRLTFQIVEAPPVETYQGPWPSDEPIPLPVGTVQDKARWFVEQSLRLLKSGDVPNTIKMLEDLVRLDGKGLMYRAENAVKAGKKTG